MNEARQSLRQGASLPYDASDPSPVADWTHKAARGVIADLKDRSDIQSALARVDEDIRVEIIHALAGIIKQAHLEAQK